MILFEILNERGEIVKIDILQIMEMIRHGQVYQKIENGRGSDEFVEWFGTLPMFLNRFQSLYVENKSRPLTHSEHFVPVTIVYITNRNIEDSIDDFNGEMHNMWLVLNSTGHS